jgi:hypothetical protein
MSYSNFGNINKKKDFYISGFHYIDGVSEPIEKAKEITILQTKEFLNYLENSSYKKQLLSNLQSMTQKEDGSLLTTWFDNINDFYNFIEQGLKCENIYLEYEGYEEYPKVLIPIFKELKEQTIKWKEYGVNEVYLEGYKLR